MSPLPSTQLARQHTRERCDHRSEGRQHKRVASVRRLQALCICPPKMVLVDIESGSIVDTYVFPSEVAPYTGSFLITITDAPSRIRHQTVVGGALCPHPSDLAMQMDMWMRSLDCAKSKNMRIHAQCMRMVTKGSHVHSWPKYSLHSVHSHAQFAHSCAVWACTCAVPAHDDQW